MLEIAGLSVRYGKHTALTDTALSVKKGEIVVILGANGAGKSTLLKAIAGICEGQTTGSVTMGSDPVLGLPAHKVVERGIALVPEGRGIFGDLTVRENLLLGANPQRAREEADANFERLIRLFPKLTDRAGQTVRTMSGGEQQMVAIGRAMMSNPEILMLDEPSLGLSPLLAKELFQNLKAVRAAGLGILLVEQNAKLSLAIADRGYLLENGRILREDKASVLLHDPAVQAAYLGGAASHATGPAKPTPAPQPAPVTPTPRARPTATVPSSQIAGLDIDALVASAAQKAVRPPSTLTPAYTASAPRPDHLHQTLSAIESAARQPRPSSLPPLRPQARTNAPTAAAPIKQRPTTGAPTPIPGGRVDIYRRRPGTSQFDKTEV
ncbi:ATP-binding cassette domain-containing protein [Pararhodobacter zhoushanensis]|uniref:ATP-binding cassette domain-containing protein n=1 Tax=Pararhodobacter zhoushanensis TaxID=2479545 RepID=UPI0015F2B1BD|nr:ATP-binding cassette domain-containing protein [Pararhodobacter zhoushanensis]